MTQKPAIQRYDAIVIGTGRAGPPLARRIATADMTVAHGILDVTDANAPYTVLQRTMPIDPTVSELLPTLFNDLHPLEWS